MVQWKSVQTLPRRNLSYKFGCFWTPASIESLTVYPRCPFLKIICPSNSPRDNPWLDPLRKMRHDTLRHTPGFWPKRKLQRCRPSLQPQRESLRLLLQGDVPRRMIREMERMCTLTMRNLLVQAAQWNYRQKTGFCVRKMPLGTVVLWTILSDLTRSTPIFIP